MKYILMIGLVLSLNSYSNNLLEGSSALTRSSSSSSLVPVLPDESSLVGRRTGQIFYDLKTSSYKGVNAKGGFDVLSNDTSLQIKDPTTVTSSSPKGRALAAAIISFDENVQPYVHTQDGNWIAGVTQPNSGQVDIEVAAKTFSAPPICTCSPMQAGVNICKIEEVPTLNKVVVTMLSVATPISSENFTVSVICVGPKP